MNDLRHASNTTALLNKTIDFNTVALKPSLSSQFEVNITSGDIVDELILEEWRTKLTPRNYYTLCNSEMCTYSLVGINDLIIVISTTFELWEVS
jgi:hypothetical protein